MGYEVVERPFTFSALPGRFATPLVGATLALLVGASGQLAASGSRSGPALTLVLGAGILFVFARWLFRHGVLRAPLLRVTGVNMEATRHPGVRPTVWLCAHLDSKSQPVPTLLRSAGIVVEGFGFLAACVVALFAVAGADPHPFYWGFAATVTLVGALPVVMSVAGERSPGALDNAAGVATVIAAARGINDPSVGVLITDGEELGLAGARAWAQGATARVILNCDGVDDIGGIEVMYAGKRPNALFDAIARASTSTSVSHHPTPMFPGLLTDSVAFNDGGIVSVTFSRGSLRTLARVHSGRDDLNHLQGTGIADTARLMAATALECRSWK